MIQRFFDVSVSKFFNRVGSLKFLKFCTPNFLYFFVGFSLLHQSHVWSWHDIKLWDFLILFKKINDFINVFLFTYNKQYFDTFYFWKLDGDLVENSFNSLLVMTDVHDDLFRTILNQFETTGLRWCLDYVIFFWFLIFKIILLSNYFHNLICYFIVNGYMRFYLSSFRTLFYFYQLALLFDSSLFDWFQI